MKSPPNPARRERPVSRPAFLAAHPDGVLVDCWVVPGASRSEIKGTHGDALRVRVASPPEGGRANSELCRLLEAKFGGKARVAAGATSRRKQVLIEGVTLSDAGAVASAWG